MSHEFVEQIPISGGVVDLTRREIRRGESVTRLTTMEYRLLGYFHARPDTLITTEQLLVEVWGYRASSRTRAVSHAILRLRKKVESDPANPVHLHTEFGEGYRWQPLTTAEVPTEAPPPPTTAPSSPRLPAERDTFIGRASDLATLQQRLSEGARLVTVLGPGGTGKTRFVLHFGNRAVEEWPGGVWFCDLSDAHSLPAMLGAMVRDLGLPGSRKPIDLIGHTLAGHGKRLIILDNFEQITALAEETIGCWLDQAREVVFVVTSREVLGLPGEQVLTLGPLPPDESAALFLTRASAAHRAFQPTDDDTAAIAELVALLDHLPLAIELAAARIRVLPPRKLLSRMSDRFRLLVAPRGRNARHSTLRATLDWSWDLLTPVEQDTLAQLSVFEGGFTMEAAEEVVDLSAHGDAPWPLDVVQALVDRSLLRQSDSGRLGMLVSVQEYASEKLQAMGDLSAIYRRHGEHFSALGTVDFLDSLSTISGPSRKLMLRQEQENIAVGLQRALSLDMPAAALRLLRAAWDTHSISGGAIDTHTLARRLLEHPGLTLDQRGHTIHILSECERVKGNNNNIEAMQLEAYRIFKQTGNLHMLGISTSTRALQYTRTGRIEQAEALYKEALGYFEACQDSDSAATTLGNYGILLAETDQRDRALECYRKAHAIHHASGNMRSEAIILNNIANVLCYQDRLSDACESYQEAMTIHHTLGDVRSEGIACGNLGSVMRLRGDLEAASRYLHTALRLHRQVGNRRSESLILSELGLLLYSTGHTEDAREHHLSALAIARDLQNVRYIGLFQGHLGSLEVMVGNLSTAHTWLTSAITNLEQVQAREATSEARCHLALLHAAQGDISEALACARAAQDTSRRPDVFPVTCCVLAMLCLQVGDVAGARQALAPLSRLTLSGPPLAHFQAAEALLLAATGQHIDARERLEAVYRSGFCHPHTLVGMLVDRTTRCLQPAPVGARLH